MLTPLDMAIIWNEIEMAKLLIKKGGKFNAMRKHANLGHTRFSKKALEIEKEAGKEAARVMQYIELASLPKSSNKNKKNKRKNGNNNGAVVVENKNENEDDSNSNSILTKEDIIQGLLIDPELQKHVTAPANNAKKRSKKKE